MSRNPLAVGLFLTLVAASSCRGDDPDDSTATTGVEASSTTSAGGSSSTTSTTAAIATTIVGSTSTSAVTSTTADGDSSTTATIAVSTTTTVVSAPTTTTTGAPALDVSNDPTRTRWIVGPQEGDPESVGPGTDCAQFFDAMGAGTLTVADCGDWNAVGGRRVWTVSKGSSGLFFGVIWQETDGTWTPLLRLLEAAPGSWESLTIKTVDIDGGPNDELVSGARFAGTGGYLDIDVIDIRDDLPVIVASVPDLVSATAFTEEDTGVWMWVPNFAAGDPQCCPSSVSQFLLSSSSGIWDVSRGVQGVAMDEIPRPSEF